MHNGPSQAQVRNGTAKQPTNQAPAPNPGYGLDGRLLVKHLNPSTRRDWLLYRYLLTLPTIPML